MKRPTLKRGRPRTGKALTAAQRMKRMRERRKADGLQPVVTWVPQTTAFRGYSGHRLLEARSLAMHTVIAQKIDREPRLLNVARINLKRWRARWQDEVPAWYEEWQQILAYSWDAIAALMTEPSERGARLRQSSPFAGTLTEVERRRIYDAFRA